MGERLRTVREPIAWIVLLISTGYIALSLVDVGLMVGRDGQSWPAVGGAIGGSSLSPTLVVAIVAAVLVCLLVAPPTLRARPIALIGAVLLSLASVLELGFTVLGAVAASHGAAIAMEVVGGVLGAGFKAALAAVLWRAWTQAPRAERPEASDGRPDAESQVPELQRPTWHPDKAVGSSWTRAGDAATGASASTYGQPGGQPTGWQVPTDLPPPATAPAPGAWVPPSQQALPPAQTPPAQTPPAQTPWATAFEAANGTPVVADDGAVSEPREGSDQRPAPLWRPVDPDQPRQRS